MYPYLLLVARLAVYGAHILVQILVQVHARVWTCQICKNVRYSDTKRSDMQYINLKMHNLDEIIIVCLSSTGIKVFQYTICIWHINKTKHVTHSCKINKKLISVQEVYEKCLNYKSVGIVKKCPIHVQEVSKNCWLWIHFQYLSSTDMANSRSIPCYIACSHVEFYLIECMVVTGGSCLEEDV